MTNLFIRKYRDNIEKWWDGQDKVKIYIFVPALALILMLYFTGYERLIGIVLMFFYSLDLLNRWSSNFSNGGKKYHLDLRQNIHMKIARQKRSDQIKKDRFGSKH